MTSLAHPVYGRSFEISLLSLSPSHLFSLSPFLPFSCLLSSYRVYHACLLQIHMSLPSLPFLFPPPTLPLTPPSSFFPQSVRSELMDEHESEDVMGLESLIDGIDSKSLRHTSSSATSYSSSSSSILLSSTAIITSSTNPSSLIGRTTETGERVTGNETQYFKI